MLDYAKPVGMTLDQMNRANRARFSTGDSNTALKAEAAIDDFLNEEAKEPQHKDAAMDTCPHCGKSLR
jgi:hypothetical protein